MVTVVEIELTDYRVPALRRLRERLEEDLVVYHGPAAPGSNLNCVQSGEDVGFRHERLAQRWLFGGRVVINNPLPVLRRPRPRVVIVRHTIRNPAFPLMLAAFRAFGIPVVGWGHGFSQRRPFQPSRHPADWAHLAVVKSCDAYVCYSEDTRQVLSRHVPAERLFVARNTVDTPRLTELRVLFDRGDRAELRAELGLDPDLPYCCFIGRLQARKRPLVLLEACALLRDEQDIRAGLVFVGEGALREELERRAAELELRDVVFAGARYGDEAARYLYASDVMAMPGALGLAAAHALALGVPVATQRLGDDLVGHGPEAAYVRDGVNGRMAGIGGAREFAPVLADVLARRAELSEGALRFAEDNLGLDRMVDGFVDAIEYASE